MRSTGFEINRADDEHREHERQHEAHAATDEYAIEELSLLDAVHDGTRQSKRRANVDDAPMRDSLVRAASALRQSAEIALEVPQAADLPPGALVGTT